MLSEVGDKFNIITCGDFNSRSQTTTELLLCDDIPGLSNISNDDTADNYKILNRNNKDNSTNTYTTQFMDLLSQANLTIANGRCLGDMFGELTCINYNGGSTVDYFLTSKPLQEKLASLTDGPLTEFSDHKTLTLTLDLSYETDRKSNLNHLKLEEAPQKYKWSSDSQTKFLEIQDNSDFRKRTNELSQMVVNNTKVLLRLTPS